MMAHEGWKYFQVKNLNELFAIMFDKYGIDENVIAIVNENVEIDVEDIPGARYPTFGSLANDNEETKVQASSGKKGVENKSGL